LQFLLLLLYLSLLPCSVGSSIHFLKAIPARCNLFLGLFISHPLPKSQNFNLYYRNRNINCRLNRGQHFTWTGKTAWFYEKISHTSYIYRRGMTGSRKHVFHVAQQKHLSSNFNPFLSFHTICTPSLQILFRIAFCYHHPLVSFLLLLLFNPPFTPTLYHFCICHYDERFKNPLWQITLTITVWKSIDVFENNKLVYWYLRFSQVCWS
jgi:hypothetical protein